VKGGTDEQKITFYSALYHSFLVPNLFMDVDGSYRGRDLGIHQAEGFDYYTVFSLWDTFRGEHPLFTLIQQDRTKWIFGIRMTKEYKLASIPVSAFYDNSVDNYVLRFCFAKKEETLEKAAQILNSIK